MAQQPNDRQELIQFLTTEHFTLQGARSAAVADTNSRLQIYMGVLSASILALALVAQISSLGDHFFAFAFVLLPMVYVFGLLTIGRLRQSWLEWFIAGRGMSRIRRFFVEAAPEADRYLILPTSDDPWATLLGTGIKEQGRLSGTLGGFFTATGVIALINSAILGVFAGLVAVRMSGEAAATAISGGAIFLLSLGILMKAGSRSFYRNMNAAEVRFPLTDSRS
jgi:hypothetical protein